MLGEERASSAIRVSLGDNTTLDDILEVISRWDHVLRRGDPKGQS
jgi:cysteine sulfinate desulfinase/cysteine desulfurase-like protein